MLPSELAPFDDILQQLAVDDLIAINAKNGRYELTKQGIAHRSPRDSERLGDLLLDELGIRELPPGRAIDFNRSRSLRHGCSCRAMMRRGNSSDLQLRAECRGISRR